jgi:energy-converting hydrogenase B subunit D
VSVLQAAALLLAAVVGTATALTREPLRQAFLSSLYGLVLGILFFVFQAPDVALSQTAVGAVALPLMILLALAKTRGGAE